MSFWDRVRDNALSFGIPAWVQVGMAFTLGLLLAPFSYGLVYYLLFLIGYEVFAIYLSAMDPRYWCLKTRLAVMLASLIGFLLGRWVDGRKDLLEDNKKIAKRKKL